MLIAILGYIYKNFIEDTTSCLLLDIELYIKLGKYSNLSQWQIEFIFVKELINNFYIY